MNCYVYGYGKPDEERLIVVDLGVTFPDMDTSPGVDLILPDISWLVERKDRIDALFVTHAHEDHVGAVGHTWEQLGVPIHARRFTANIARRKLDEHGAPPEALVVCEGYPSKVEVGPFAVTFLPLSHSVPESAGLMIETPAGRVVHTGDFKLDTSPVVGEPYDEQLWSKIGKLGVNALVCDSTNVFSRNEGRSEATVGPEIERLMGELEGMVVATTFASNIARVKQIAVAAEKAGRSVCLLGRAMRRMIEAATEEGIIHDFPSTISPEDVQELPRENVCLIVTGSQGERRAASAQLANGKYLGLTVEEGDTFLFSSKTIPGNERGVIRIINQFSEKGVDVIDDASGLYHVSGHANRPDLERMHAVVNPQTVIPMHGEHRHLREHAKIAERAGRQAVLAVNGMMVDLTGNAPTVAEYVETGRTYLDGRVQIGALDGIVRDRIRMALNGQLVVTLLLDENDEPLGDPWVEVNGLPEVGVSGAPLSDIVEADLGQFLGRAKEETLANEEVLERQLRKVARQTAQQEIGKKPEVTVVVSRLA